MKLEIITPVEKVYEGQVESVQMPGSQGSFEVLENHAAIVSSLEEGTVLIRKASDTENIDISGGVVEVLNNHIVILAESVTA
ncbi:MAG: ATP synthase F1 subunit epsilon [Bernardetiaceae bacterium]|nr:ATP synthase F1 subunit epsilon [Bernardetiaceae bacterium]